MFPICLLASFTSVDIFTQLLFPFGPPSSACHPLFGPVFTNVSHIGAVMAFLQDQGDVVSVYHCECTCVFLSVVEQAIYKEELVILIGPQPGFFQLGFQLWTPVLFLKEL